MNALAYVRVSTKEQAEEGFSLEAQKAAIQQYAQEKGLTLLEVFEERGESATTAERSQFKRMLERIQEDDSVEHVIVHKIDRFGRNLEDYVGIRSALKERGVRILSVSENLDDSVAGVLVENVLASISDWYSKNLSVETKKGKLQKAKEGWYPSVAPIGYRNEDGKIVLDPETAPLIRELFELYATGEWTLKRLQQEMTVRGLKGKGGRPLSISRIAAILNNPFYEGRFLYGGVEYEGKHEPIVSSVLAAAVRKALDANGTARTRTRQVNHYLKGLLWCRCGKRLSTTRAKGHVYFFCLGREQCSEPYLRADRAEELVEELYQGIALPELSLKRLVKELEAEIEEQEASKIDMAQGLERRVARMDREADKLMQAYYADAIPVEVLKREQDRIVSEKVILQAKIQGMERRVEEARELVKLALKLAKDCRKAYLMASPEVRRLWNDALFEKVTIRERKVHRVVYREPFRSLYSSAGCVSTRSRRRTGIEPASELSPAHRF